VDTTPVPFASLGLDHRLLEGTRDLGWKDTRPIQTAVIPLALANHDLIACAETGTGKTAAFVVPTLQRLLLDHEKNLAAEAESGLPRKSRVPQVAARELVQMRRDPASPITTSRRGGYGGVKWGCRARPQRQIDIIVATPAPTWRRTPT
jgi:ATP-dependent RNA helicase RhlE